MSAPSAKHTLPAICSHRMDGMGRQDSVVYQSATSRLAELMADLSKSTTKRH